MKNVPQNLASPQENTIGKIFLQKKSSHVQNDEKKRVKMMNFYSIFFVFSFSRHCGRLLCSKCSAREMPIIKYNLSKAVRVCDTCADVITVGPNI